MDYVEELKRLLRPLRLYDVDSGLGGAELRALGAGLNGILGELETAERELTPLTAEQLGLERWEALLPFIPVYRTLEDRRQAIAALLRIDGAGFTLRDVNDTIAGCGIPAVAEEDEDAAQTVRVSFPGQRGEPDNIDELKTRIERILPCHLNVSYVFVYVMWREMEALFPTWELVENASDCWRHLERFGGDEP